MSNRLEAGLVLELGSQAGLSDCGIASVRPSDHGEHLDQWLRAGAHASMAWMERTASIRKELTSKWDWAQSALVGVLDYSSGPAERSELGGIAEHIARYARGEDYHDVLKARLEIWAEGLRRNLGQEIRSAALVDTSAVLERELALRAGLGWIGKNTCLIGEGGNSWRFIGVLLTDLEFEVTGQTVADRCGTCRACIDACPTAALDEPYFVDSRRCISYLTIEHRGTIDQELSDGIGAWLFGCDICQEVCPWNRRVEPGDVAEFSVKPRWEALTLADVAGLDDEGFRKQFRGTPLSRPKRAGMVRNALIAGANIADRSVIEIASKLLDDEDETVRETAARVVEKSRGS